MIETMMAAAILVIGSLSVVGLIFGSIASNNRNKIDSTQTMLAQAIVEYEKKIRILNDRINNLNEENDCLKAKSVFFFRWHIAHMLAILGFSQPPSILAGGNPL